MASINAPTAHIRRRRLLLVGDALGFARLTHGQHGARRRAHDALRDVAHQNVHQRPAAVRAHHDQVGSVDGCRRDDASRRVAKQHLGRDAHVRQSLLQLDQLALGFIAEPLTPVAYSGTHRPPRGR